MDCTVVGGNGGNYAEGPAVVRHKHMVWEEGSAVDQLEHNGGPVMACGGTFEEWEPATDAEPARRAEMAATKF